MKKIVVMLPLLAALTFGAVPLASADAGGICHRHPCVAGHRAGKKVRRHHACKHAMKHHLQASGCVAK